MNLDTYRAATNDTAVYPDAGSGSMAELTYLAQGLAGEANEAVDCIKKALRNGGLSEQMRQTLASELGDVIWYWVRLVHASGYDAEGIMLANWNKLAARHKER